MSYTDKKGRLLIFKTRGLLDRSCAQATFPLADGTTRTVQQHNEEAMQRHLQFPHSPCADLSKSVVKINWVPLERLTVEKGNVLVRGRSLTMHSRSVRECLQLLPLPHRCAADASMPPPPGPQPPELRKAGEVTSELLKHAKKPPQQYLREIQEQARGPPGREEEASPLLLWGRRWETRTGAPGSRDHGVARAAPTPKPAAGAASGHPVRARRAPESRGRPRAGGPGRAA